ncbi:MAG: cytochrome d ubiquinol oxidase subunit II [Alphaproteobacteria bacterium]|nr:cytochrome d ubiquinol oxidase subunit II [Alphaproteobacteria bacterium]
MAVEPGAFDLAFIWAMLIAFAVLAYVVLDGFDLGIGMLFPLLQSDVQRDTAMNTVAPVWDGNETWLVLGGGGLLAVFPLSYAIIMPALYAPVIVMLLGLLFRGVAFEYRWRTQRWRPMWDWSFTIGSLAAALSQGIILGTMLQGIEVENRQYAGGWWDWLTPFSLACGVGVVVGFSLLGATWIVMKTEGALQERARRLAWFTGFGTLGMIGVVSLWTPFLDPIFMQRWFAYPAIIYVAPVPLLVLAAAWSLAVGLRSDRDWQPFLSALALFILCFIGLGISFYPYIVPPTVTIWDAAAPDSSLMFLLVGAAVLIPLILLYTAYAYWVFRGKVREGEGYH